MTTITLPCGHEIPEADLLRIAGAALSAKRKTRAGGRNGGAPRSADRCPCGAMTKRRAEQRNHRCHPETPPAA